MYVYLPLTEKVGNAQHRLATSIERQHARTLPVALAATRLHCASAADTNAKFNANKQNNNDSKRRLTHILVKKTTKKGQFLKVSPDGLSIHSGTDGTRPGYWGVREECR